MKSEKKIKTKVKTENENNLSQCFYIVIVVNVIAVFAFNWFLVSSKMQSGQV